MDNVAPNFFGGLNPLPAQPQGGAPLPRLPMQPLPYQPPGVMVNTTIVTKLIAQCYAASQGNRVLEFLAVQLTEMEFNFCLMSIGYAIPEDLTKRVSHNTSHAKHTLTPYSQASTVHSYVRTPHMHPLT
jgi:hypothetical protein